MQKQIGFATRITFILLILTWFHFQTAYARDVNGVISADTRWTTADSPINITGEVRVEAGVTLAIDPGVEVIFQSSADTSQGYSIRIDGMLIALGDQMDPIFFTAADKSVPWGAIVFTDTSVDWNQATSTGSVIEYCVIEYGGNEPNGAGMISTVNAMPRITKNAIRFGVASGISALVSDDPAVISSLSGKIHITSNLIYNNVTGIRFSAEGGIIENNYFLNNNRAIDLQVRSNNVQIKNNTVLSSAPELFGTGIRLFLDEAANGIASYQWQQTSGTSVVLSNPNSARTAFIASDPGSNVETLTFDLTVTNKTGLQSTDTVRVTITGDNPPPVANAGTDGNVQLPQEEGQVTVVTLSGAGSSDPYLGIADYAWEQTEGKTVDLQDADTINPSFTVPASVVAGDHMTFQLTVTDQGGLSSSDAINMVYYDDNIYPIAVAGDDRAVSQGSTVVLNATGSADPDGSIAGYTWVQTDGPPVDLVNPNTAIPYFEAPTDNPSDKTFTFRLQVTDNGGLQAIDDISITVKSSLIADIQASLLAGGRVILDGSTSVDQNASADIDIEKDFLSMDNADAGLIALSVNENAAFQLNITENNFNTIDDNKGYIVYTYNWSGKAPMSIAVPENWWGTDDTGTIENLIYDQKNNYQLPEVDYQPFAGQEITGTGSSLPYPPLADAGPDMETAADNSVTLDGRGSYDPDEIAGYLWKQIDGPTVNLKNADQAVASFIAPSGGPDGVTLQFQLTVSTGDTFTHSDTVNVTIDPDAALPIVDVGGCFVQSAMSNQRNNSFLCAFMILFFSCLIAALRYRLRGLFPGVCILLAALILISSPAHAGYLAVGGGDGGDADEYNVTIETGAKDIDFNKLDLLFGIGIFFNPYSDNNLPSPTIAVPSPNDDSVKIGNARKGTGVGFTGKLGVEIGSSDFYVSAIGGFTAYTESTLSRSPATGRVYEDTSDSKIKALYGGGVSYFVDYKWDVILQVDYDNIRGVTGTIGWYW